MKTTLLILALAVTSVSAQGYKYDLSNVPYYLKKNKIEGVDGWVTGLQGTNVILAVVGQVRVTSPGAASYGRAGGKMTVFRGPPVVNWKTVTNYVRLRAYPKWQKVEKGDRVSCGVVYGPSMAGIRDGWYVPNPKSGKHHSG